MTVDFRLHPDPTAAEREAVRVALVRTNAVEQPGSRAASAWRGAGLRESVDRHPQDTVPRSSRGATRA